MIWKAISKDNTRVAYIATTYQQARDIVWEMLKNVAGKMIVSANESRLEIRLRSQDKGISTIVLRGWESIETLRGQLFDFVVVDEIASMRGWRSGWYEVIRPTLTDRRGHALFISTPKGYNHFHDLFQKENEDSDYKAFHFTTYDNPYIPIDEIEKAKKELSEEEFNQEYLAEFRKFSGLVFPNFDRKIHTVRPFSITSDFVINMAIDPHPREAHRVTWVATNKIGVDYVIDELTIKGNTKKVVMAIRAKERPEWRIQERLIDPSADIPDQRAEIATSMREMFEEYKMYFELGSKKRDDARRKMEDGFNYSFDETGELIDKPTLYIFNNCVETIKEIENYVWDEWSGRTNDNKLPKQKPIDKNDHHIENIGRILINNYTFYELPPDKASMSRVRRHFAETLERKQQEPIDETAFI